MEPFCNITTNAKTKVVTARSIDSANKTKFAEHVYSNGTKDYFEHFDDLKAMVQELLVALERAK